MIKLLVLVFFVTLIALYITKPLISTKVPSHYIASTSQGSQSLQYIPLLNTSNDAFINHPPTKTNASLIRGAVGAYMARRDGGKLHSGVDIVANQSSLDKETYAVFAVNNGKVVYAQVNGSDEKGYGYTIVLDHGTNNYSQYSHLATNSSRNIVKLGESVKRGQKIGYLADLANNEKSSGNVRSDVVLQYDKIQLHFECFEAPSGRSSTTTLSKLKKDYKLIDPTPKLVSLGYSSF